MHPKTHRSLLNRITGIATLLVGMVIPLCGAAQPKVVLEYIGEFGTDGEEAGQFRLPRVVDVDRNDRV